MVHNFMTELLEAVRPGVTARKARVALFDFDGTLSLVRSGWMEVMIPMMVEILQDLKTGESEQDLRVLVEDFVWRLTGKETIYQMFALSEAIQARGGKPLDPLEYKKMYLDRLWVRIESRVDELKKGHAAPEKYMVPGTVALLEALKERGIKLYLASGTDEIYMKEEARLLGLNRFFDGGIYGALDDYKSFSKAILIQRILDSAEFRGDEFLGFGDGYVEIEEVKKVGGVTVGVATEEPHCQAVDAWKRKRLIGVGADYIVPNYLAHKELLTALFPAA